MNKFTQLGLVPEFDSEMYLTLKSPVNFVDIVAAEVTGKTTFSLIKYFRIGFTDMRQGCG